MGDHAAAPRAGPRLRARRPTREARVLAAEPYPGAVEAVRALARGRALHPHHVAPRRRRRRRPPSAGCERIGLPLRRALLLLRQGRPLPRDRHRRADRRLARSTSRRALDAGIAAATLAAPVEPRAVRDRGRDLRRRLARARARTWSRCWRERPRARCRRAPPSPDLRDHLPAIEPERTVTDWGRSERVEGLARPDALRRSSTTTGSAARSRGSSTSRPPAAPCSSPTTPARSRPTRR